MDLLNIPNIRVNQLQTLGESSLEICQNLPEIAPSAETVKQALDKYLAGMTREKASAAEKKKLDKIRDRLVSGFIRQVKAEQLFPHENEQAISTLQKLVLVVNKYGSEITRLTYDEESAAMDNLIAEIGELDLSPLNNSGIARWIEPIQASNDVFKSTSAQYISDSAATSQTESATNLAPALIEALEEMYNMLYAYIKVKPTDELIKAYTELEKLVNSFN